MKVTLISYTPDAVSLLLFTKSTRLNMAPALLDKIRSAPEAQRMKDLEYMANTIPSSWEFVDYVFMVESVSRAYTHQAVRTRAASYAQQSLRVVDAGDFEFVMPKRLEGTSWSTMPGKVWGAQGVIKDTVSFIQESYRRLTKEYDVATEDARSILPTNIATNIVCKYNLRTFAELCRSRMGGRTQGEYIDVVNAMYDAVIEVHPWASLFLAPQGRDYFADIEAFAEREYAGDLIKKGELLKIVDKMRKEA